MTMPISSSLNPTAHIDALNRRQMDTTASRLLSEQNQSQVPGDDAALKEAFNDFVGQTFFGQLLSSLRSTQGEVAYFNGGRAEEIFQGQLDQVLTEKISEASADKIANPMYDLFRLPRS
jgi:flagellar protein FlgJ